MCKDLNASVRIQYLAASAYKVQCSCWYREKIATLISLNELQSFDEQALMRLLDHWNALLS